MEVEERKSMHRACPSPSGEGSSACSSSWQERRTRAARQVVLVPVPVLMLVLVLMLMLGSFSSWQTRSAERIMSSSYIVVPFVVHLVIHGTET
ncbi:hypothetical protein C8R44DRAFT_786868 [Mycena epipterygia]|nr:hypothetical protein C8R44DRAFT_786868 [Mycena epipterygia]